MLGAQSSKCNFKKIAEQNTIIHWYFTKTRLRVGWLKLDYSGNFVKNKVIQSLLQLPDLLFSCPKWATSILNTGQGTKKDISQGEQRDEVAT